MFSIINVSFDSSVTVCFWLKVVAWNTHFVMLSSDLEFKLVLVHDMWFYTDNVCLDYVGEVHLSHMFFSGQLRCCCWSSVWMV